MDPLPQEELSALLGGGGCFLKRARGDDALFVCDAPARLPEDTLEALERKLSVNGFVCSRTNRDLWKIDLSPERYRRLITDYQNVLPAPFPKDDRDLDVYALMRLWLAHPAPWAEQPAEPLRAVLKRYARLSELRALAPRLLADSAKRLGKHLSLPHAAAGLLAHRLLEAGEEETS